MSYKNPIFWQFVRLSLVLGIFLSIPVNAGRYYTVYVTNQTPYYIDAQWRNFYRYAIPPGKTASLEGAGGASSTAYVWYTAGQGIYGYAVHQFDAHFPPPYDAGTDCAGRTVYYGENNGCNNPVQEESYGYPDSEEWVITEAVMEGEPNHDLPGD
jgi:hypothetical protein